MWRVPSSERWRVDNPPRTWSHRDPGQRDYGSADPETYGPVQTEAGEEMRQLAMGVLLPKMQRLVDRSKFRALRLFEREELDSLIQTLETLTSMAPVGPLLKGGANTI
jgi:hypothetical protein